MDALPFAHLVPHLRAKKHLTAKTALPLDASQPRPARRCDAIVVGEQVLLDLAAKSCASLIQCIEASLLFLGLPPGRFLFLLDKSLVAGQLLACLCTAGFELVRTFHALQFLIFEPADFILRKGDFMLQRVELLVGFDAARLLAEFGDLLLLVFDVAFQATAFGFFRLDRFVCLLNPKRLYAQLFFQGGKVTGQCSNGLPELCDFYIGFLQTDKVFKRVIYHLKVQSSTREGRWLWRIGQRLITGILVVSINGDGSAGDGMASRTELGAMPVHAGLTPRPVSLPPLNGFDLKARYQAARCNGDFFDAVMAGSRVIFLLTDIAGSRAEAHPVAANVQVVFRTKAQEMFESPGANESESIALLARDVNRSLIDAARGVRFAPAFLGCFNLTVSVLTYHNAGALNAIFRDAEGVRVLESGGIPLGLFTHNTYEPAVLAFEPGAKLLLVTKGVTESRRGSTTFGVERVRRVLENANTDSALKICEDVLREASEFNDHPWSRLYDFFHPSKRQCRDDMTAVALVRPDHLSGDLTE